MTQDAQVALAKTFWEQSRTAAVQAHQAWQLVMNSQKMLMDSMRSSGMPFAVAADQFDKLMQFHAEQHKAALEHMDRMSAELVKLLSSRKS